MPWWQLLRSVIVAVGSDARASSLRSAVLRAAAESTSGNRSVDGRVDGQARLRGLHRPEAQQVFTRSL